ncbi:hypothetical protein BJX96DRAFT_122316 [Aspergillus floccosus]
MSGEVLESDADYGRPPFDIFLSERWDNTTSNSWEQWERLVWEWQDLTLMERWPYQNRAQSESSPPELSEEIKHVLATHQTAHERNISLVSCDGWQTVWLRTCYDPDLADKYEKMKWESEVPGWGVAENKVLDDPSRYNFDDGSADCWRRVLVRVPGITDFRGVIDMYGDESSIEYLSGQNVESEIALAQEVEEQWRELSLVELRIQAGLYLLDREAIEYGMVKILWLDEHGQIAWENRCDPYSLQGLTSALLSATRLVELGPNDGARGGVIHR